MKLKAQSGLAFFGSPKFAGCLVLFTGDGTTFDEDIEIQTILPLRDVALQRLLGYQKGVKINSSSLPITIYLDNISYPVEWTNDDSGVKVCMKDLWMWGNESVSSGGSGEVSPSTQWNKIVRTYNESGQMTRKDFYQGTTFVYGIVYTYDTTTGDLTNEEVTLTAQEE